MSDFSFARNARPRSPATRTRSVVIQAFMLDSEFVRSLLRFADPVSRWSALSTSDHDNHRPCSPLLGTFTPVSNTLAGGVVVGAAVGVGVGVVVTGAAEEAATCFGAGVRTAANVITPAATTATTAANAAVLIFTARKASARARGRGHPAARPPSAAGGSGGPSPGHVHAAPRSASRLRRPLPRCG